MCILIYSTQFDPRDDLLSLTARHTGYSQGEIFTLYLKMKQYTVDKMDSANIERAVLALRSDQHEESGVRKILNYQLINRYTPSHQPL